MDDRHEDQSEDQTSPRDRNLIERIRSGDPDAIMELLCQRCGRAINHLKTRFIYEELLGDLYLELIEEDWRKLTQWRGECALESWIWKIAISLCIQRARREKRIVLLESEELLKCAGSESPDFDGSLRRRDLLRAIKCLKDPRQRALLSGILQGEPVEKIAETLRITRSYADTLKSRAINRLREIIHERERVQNA